MSEYDEQEKLNKDCYKQINDLIATESYKCVGWKSADDDWYYCHFPLSGNFRMRLNPHSYEEDISVPYVSLTVEVQSDTNEYYLPFINTYLFKDWHIECIFYIMSERRKQYI